MAQLNSITVKGYKSIRELSNFQLKPLNILIGANGAGKSNFVMLFDLLYNIVSGNLQLTVGKAGGVDSFLHFGQKVTAEIKLELLFGSDGYKLSLIPGAGDVFVFSEETVCFRDGCDTPSNWKMLGHGGHRESLLIVNRYCPSCILKMEEADTKRIAADVLKFITSWQIYHFHDTSDSAMVKKTGDIGDNRSLRTDASNLAAYLYLLKKTKGEYYNNIVDAIRLAAPFFDDFILEPTQLNENKIRLEWKERGSDSYFDAHSLSDGTLRFICLATLLLQPELPETILLDEPELGLHPYSIAILAELLRSASKRTQVIVSTQSVTLVDQFTPEDVIVVDRIDGQSTFKHLSAEEIAGWMDEYSLGELWQKNIIGGRPR
ncbi:AAA family ATPase [bacterium]|nr:AAA family ATPase [bacterium]